MVADACSDDSAYRRAELLTVRGFNTKPNAGAIGCRGLGHAHTNTRSKPCAHSGPDGGSDGGSDGHSDGPSDGGSDGHSDSGSDG